MSCKQCGQCCEAIAVGMSHEEINEALIKNNVKLTAINDYKFVLHNWRPVSRAKAEKLNPLLKLYSRNCYFYVCKKYNRKEKKCTVQGTKPTVCSGFPFYTNYDVGMVADTLLHEGCGYWVDKYRAQIYVLIKNRYDRCVYDMNRVLRRKKHAVRNAV